MVLTSDYRPIWATFKSEIKYSRKPTRGRWSVDYYFTVGPLEYCVKFHIYRQNSNIYVMMFKPVRFNGTPEEQAALYEKVTGNPPENIEDIDWLMDEWLDSEESLKMTGTGASFQVISNVISTVNRFLREKDSAGEPVYCLNFTASNEEESRIRVYSKIADIYQGKGFTVQKKPEGKHTQFYICREE